MNARKLLVSLSVLMLVGLACNLSNPQGPPETGIDQPAESAPEGADLPDAGVDAVATVVAQTVAAEQAAQETAQPSTDAPESTATATPETPTATPTATATATEPPPPTSSPDDPKLALGNYDWQDAFNSGGNWTLFDEPEFKSEVKNGKYVMTKKTTEYGERWEVTWPQIEDFYLEVTATTGDKCSGKDRYGIFFRAPDPSKGYLFGFSCDGQFRFSVWTGSDYKVILNWTTSPHILSGANQTNRIGILAEGKNYSFYANGKLLATATDNTFTSKGKFGFFIGAADTPNFVVRFDDFTYWENP